MIAANVPESSRSDLLSDEIHLTSESENRKLTSPLPIPAPAHIPFPWYTSKEDLHSVHFHSQAEKCSGFGGTCPEDVVRTISLNLISCNKQELECNCKVSRRQSDDDRSCLVKSDLNNYCHKPRSKYNSVFAQTKDATTSEYSRTQSPSLDLLDRNNLCDDQAFDKLTESPVPARIPSPSSASSITSGKRLEWDSGADVGYIYTHEDYEHSNETLSTIERLAIVRGCSAALFRRLDPEGFSGPPKPVANIQSSSISFNTPVANSTPISRGESLLLTKIDNETVPEIEPAETVLPGGYLYVHCEEEFENDVAPAQNNSEESSNVGKDDRPAVDLSKKLSNSLINLRSNLEENIKPNFLVRSQSFLNLCVEREKQMIVGKRELHTVQQPQTIATTCSVSSSSVATIVQKLAYPKTCDKIIQTLPLKLSVGVQVDENSDHHPCEVVEKDLFSKISVEEGIFHDNTDISSHSSTTQKVDSNVKQSTVLNNNFESIKCTGAHRKGSSDPCPSCRNGNHNLTSHIERNVMSQVLAGVNEEGCNFKDGLLSLPMSDIGTTESATSSSKTGGSYKLHHSSSAIKLDGVHSSVGVVDSANSFEYLPGDIFEHSLQKSEAFSGSHSINLNNVSSTNSTGDNRCQNTHGNARYNTLAKGVEEGVALLQKLISGKAFKGKMRKKMIQEIVNKLVNTNQDECSIQSSTENTQSSRSSVISHPKSSGIVKQVMKQHLGSGDCADHGSQSVNSECSNRSIESEHCNRSIGESALELSDEIKVVSEASEKHSSNSSCTPSGSVSVPGDNEHSRGDSSELSSVAFSTNYQRNWKLPTSKSEKVYESHRGPERRVKSMRNNDYTPPLLKLCKTEHVKQLEWIKFEINHLTRLKQLLEKQEGITKSLTKLASQDNNPHLITKNLTKSSVNQESNCSDDPSNWHQRSKSSILETSESACYEECLPSNLHKFGLSQVIPSTVLQDGKKDEDIQKKLRSSTHSQGSYILSDVNDKFSKEESINDMRNRKRGKLNVFLEQSPNLKERSCHVSHIENKSFKGSKRTYLPSHDSMVKCCCECKKALNAIAMRQKENPSLAQKHVHTFCKCHFMDIICNENSVSSHDHGYLAAWGHSEGVNKRVLPENSGMRETVNPPYNLSLRKTGKEQEERQNETRNDCSEFKNVSTKNCPCCGCMETDTHITANINTNLEGRTSPVKKNLCNDATVQANIKEPLAYLLTFEPSAVENSESRNTLPEIKLLVPPSQNMKKQFPSTPISTGNSSKENQHPLNRNQTQGLSNHCSSDHQDTKKHKLTLQEYLKNNRPDYIQHADKRSQCLAELALLRDMRKQKRLELLKLTRQQESTEAKDSTPEEIVILNGIAMPGKRTFTSREMKDQARQKYRRSKEVQNKIAERKKKEDFRTNRLMAELFTKNLQKRALKGIVNHSFSASLSSY